MPLTLFSPPSCRPLDQVGDVHRHFLDLSRVELLDITHHSNVLCGNKVYGHTIKLAYPYVFVREYPLRPKRPPRPILWI
jgi:hypothetical protein